MKSSIAALLFLVAFGCQVSWGQTSGDCKPSSLNIPEAKYPCVYPDNRATFRVVAPDAQKVSVRIGPGFDMQKGPDNVWEVTTTPLVIGFHYYTLQIDGAVVADPSTMTYFGSGWQNSGIEIPASGRRLLRREGSAARPREPAVVLLEGDRQVAAVLCLHAAGLRHQHARALSGPLPAARLGGR